MTCDFWNHIKRLWSGPKVLHFLGKAFKKVMKKESQVFNKYILSGILLTGSNNRFEFSPIVQLIEINSKSLICLIIIV